jgi:hypothetical protein
MSQTYNQGATADAFVSSYSPNADNNYGLGQDGDNLRIGRPGSGSIYETFCNFDLSPIPMNAKIISATFGIRQYDSDNDYQSATIQATVELCGAVWNEGGITWNNKPANAIGTPQAFQTIHNENNYRNFDVAAHIRAIVTGQITWNGFRVRYTGTSSGTSKYFYSRENLYPPLLTIVWEYPYDQVNVGGAWKQVSMEEVNIGGAWKPVTNNEMNVGDVWKQEI